MSREAEVRAAADPRSLVPPRSEEVWRHCPLKLLEEAWLCSDTLIQTSARYLIGKIPIFFSVPAAIGD